MTTLLRGLPVAEAMNNETKARAEVMIGQGILPTLAIVRVGQKADDISYEKNASKRCQSLGIGVQNVVFEENIDPDTFFRAMGDIAQNPAVHGILLLRPLPGQLDGEKARCMIPQDKDVDGCTDASLTGVFTGNGQGFAPCTAQAAMEILRFYGMPVSGKRAVVVGRSLVVGRPLAMMLMHENATVTICHTRTQNLAQVIREADLVVAACGQMESIGAESLRPGQAVIDVGISWNSKKQKLCGDIRQEEAEGLVDALTPVPGGVGSVTTAVLCRHVVEAAERMHV
ncbi:MAG: bifunctional 5,10-methylenetetrahydrofolate dehydrogenase/5,10-methenyltetrahydrofolate cyclohydrolase [Clostridia bacterium]|nr:bifunctional 5,10-methylenetetrahydrofolate dehydrogenase/5,10-methenyltetrahydrofolate cyclohydrolase [Clostridia bacterium]